MTSDEPPMVERLQYRHIRINSSQFVLYKPKKSLKGPNKSNAKKGWTFLAGREMFQEIFYSRLDRKFTLLRMVAAEKKCDICLS